MAITLKLPDDSPENKRRLVAASGGYNVPDTTNNDTHYVKSTTTRIPIAKFSQSVSGSGNVTMTQPEFFSPMHTPQSWQIPARRRELIQWSFIDNKESPCYITKNGEFSLINIKDIVEKYENLDKLYIQNGKGEKATIDRVAKRYVNKKANKIRILGIAEDLYITNDHDCMIIKGEDVKCYREFNHKKCVCNYLAPSCKRAKCEEYKNKEYKITKIKARDIKKGDYVLVPFDITVKKSVIRNKEQARFAGHLASDGYISKKYKETSICMNIEEINDVLPCIEKVFNDHSVATTLSKRHKSRKVVSIRTFKRSLFKFSSALVKGKGVDKKFTEEVTLLKPELQLHVLGAYIQTDGSFNKINKCIEITTYSRHLANQLINMMYRCNILGRVNKQPISRSEKTFFTKNKYRYIVNISSSECHKIKKYVPGKIKEGEEFKNKRHNKRFFW